MAQQRRFTVWSIGLLAVCFGLIALWSLPRPVATARSHDAQSQIKALLDRVQELEAKLACMTKDGDNVVFEKCNVYIRSGSGKTDGEVNGLGNLIIGYNESSGESIKRTGSHNLVIGPEHAYASFGGLVAGRENTLGAPHASVTAGRLNTASGIGASVSGGSVNTASNDFASVSGGKSNEVKGLNASVSGGTSNTAQGDFAGVTGGSDNAANGFASSVSGGSGNVATGNYASVSGGKRRDATAHDSWRGGNLLETN
ncbi:MAG: hypothetical protein FJZ47_05585 [Candidatus Tectomicrobia bacterium]|uniref:Trimeric autotransporter adhesin YadA-like head domain-containing protein n=1 Tax=Tectimicrobiota bacterium TaxID=2528274 RepID=A0A938B1T2_UNCTE|nr:hypothetical protein [Candidatus Tectomicrobia bacterium]